MTKKKIYKNILLDGRDRLGEGQMIFDSAEEAQKFGIRHSPPLGDKKYVYTIAIEVEVYEPLIYWDGKEWKPMPEGETGKI